MRSTVLKNLKKTIVLAGVGTVFIGYNSSKCPTTNKRKLNMFGEELRESGSAFLLRTVLAPYVSLATLPAGAKNNRELLTSVMIQSFLKGKEMSEELPAYERLDNITNRLLDNNPELTKDAKPNIHITAKNDMPAYSLADHIVISLDFLNKSSDSQVAFLIGHELSHHLLDHHAEVLSWKVLELFTFGALIAVFSRNKVTFTLLWIVLKPFKLLATYPAMRNGEFDADELGLEMMMKAGYDPLEVIQMWDYLEMVSPDVPPFLMDHPSHQQRRARQVMAVCNNSEQ